MKESKWHMLGFTDFAQLVTPGQVNDLKLMKIMIGILFGGPCQRGSQPETPEKALRFLVFQI